MSEREVRQCIESVSMNVGSMRYAEALREAARLAPVEGEALKVSRCTRLAPSTSASVCTRVRVTGSPMSDPAVAS